MAIWNRNKTKLKDGEKIFSLSEYSEILQNNRKKLLQQLKEYGTLMKPMNYVKMKSELNKKVYILSKIDFNSKIENEYYSINISKDTLNYQGTNVILTSDIKNLNTIDKKG